MSVPAGTVPLPYTGRDLALALGDGWEKTLVRAYEWMVFGRVLDGRMLGLQRQGRIGFYGPATGQEAVNVGAALAVAPEDWVFPGLREQLLALVRGHPLQTYVHHLFADNLDPSRGRQMPCHPTARDVRYVSMSSVIGTQVSQAVGVAYAQKMRKEKGTSLAFFGDGATSANDVHAALNFAGVFGLPLVFCCANNQWAISVPVERQSHVARLADKAVAYGMPGRRVDGTDLVAVLRELSRALEDARAGRGPTLLEFVLYRMTAHSSSDDPTRYQGTDWKARAQANDPLYRLEALLRQEGLIDDGRIREVTESFDRAVRAAIDIAEATPVPSNDSLSSDVLASPPTSAAVAPGG